MPRRDEFELIDWIRQRAQVGHPVIAGIGDDAAVLAGPGARTIGESQSAGPENLLVTTDMLIEGWHFTLETATPEQIGRKALAVNLSDIAAMAGRPTAAFISLALPKRHGRRLAEGLYGGLEPLAREFGVTIAGGDTNSWDGPLVVNVTLLGETSGRGAVLRSGARPGDRLYCTGPLGGSRAERQFSFLPRVELAQRLHREFELHAMMDLSDGLASDLPHLARESGVAGIVRAGAVPIHADVSPDLPAPERLHHALSDGEDFELLIAVGPEASRDIEERAAELSLHWIGQVEPGEGCFLEVAGTRRPLEATGWTHRFE